VFKVVKYFRPVSDDLASTQYQSKRFSIDVYSPYTTIWTISGYIPIL